MKKILFLIIAAFLAYGFLHVWGISTPNKSLSVNNSDSILQHAYDNQKIGLQVEGKGVVIRMLGEDLDGLRHQRFILQLESGQTLLISHNIDLAPKINRLMEGDSVEFYGEYEWNPEGGVIHWTHRDPDNKHVAGWLKHGGRIYQ